MAAGVLCTEQLATGACSLLHTKRGLTVSQQTEAKLKLKKLRITGATLDSTFWKLPLSVYVFCSLICSLPGQTVGMCRADAAYLQSRLRILAGQTAYVGYLMIVRKEIS